MKPYKGYLIEEYSETSTSDSGFGLAVQGPRTQVWRTRVIDSATGDIHMLPVGSGIARAERYVDALLDPTGLERKRESLLTYILSTKAEIADAEELIDDENRRLLVLLEKLNTLKEEYRTIGGSDEQA